MLQATYTVDGLKGLLKDGGSKRRAVVEKAIAGLGGKVEGFYFAFGPTDVVIVVDYRMWPRARPSGSLSAQAGR